MGRAGGMRMENRTADLRAPAVRVDRPRKDAAVPDIGRRLPEMSQMLIDFTNWANAHATVILLTALAVLVGLAVLERAVKNKHKARW